MTLALDQAYARELVRLLHEGAGMISPRDAKGLIGFPSYHAVLALLVTWYARKLAFLRWPALLLNSAVLLATPIQGGHHLVDVLAAFPVAAVVIFLAEKAAQAKHLVNNMPKFTLTPVPQGFLRITAEQKDESEALAIKLKLSGFS
jgi:membrane-associated phospholipid phosphatase